MTIELISKAQNDIGFLLDDLESLNEKSAMLSLLTLPLLRQAVEIKHQLALIKSAIAIDDKAINQ